MELSASTTASSTIVRRPHKALLGIHKQIEVIGDLLNLSNLVIQRGKQICNLMDMKKKVTATSVAANAAIYLYLASSEHKTHRPIQKFCKLSNITVKDFKKLRNKITKMLDMKVESATATIEDHIHYLCGALALSNTMEQAARTISYNVRNNFILPGRMPIIVACAAVYMLSQRLMKKTIAEAAGIYEGTIQTTYMLMFPHIDKLLPEEFIGRIRIE